MVVFVRLTLLSVFTLLRRLVIALDERQVQVKAFERLDKNVDDSDRHTWKKAVRAWERNPDGPSPYMMPQLGMFYVSALIQLELDNLLETGLDGQYACAFAIYSTLAFEND